MHNMKVSAYLLAIAYIAVAEPPSPQYLPANGNGLPSNQYGAPQHTSPPRPQYGAPNGGGYDDGSQSEPAHYHFEYMVQDAESGNDFGHEESREGDVAQGKYYVLLPDGRKQIVQYVADNEGYKPTITYEGGNGNGNGNGNGEYPRHNGNGNGGYPRPNGNGGYPKHNGNGDAGGNGNGGYNY